MSSPVEKIYQLIKLVESGKTLKAFDLFYHPLVLVQENEDVPISGKIANKQKEEAFAEAISEVRVAKALKVCSGENITMVEWHFDFTHAVLGRRNYKQVAIQEWKDGLIIKEKFYYPN